MKTGFDTLGDTASSVIMDGSGEPGQCAGNGPLLSARTVASYLVERGLFDRQGTVEARELGGGVSNVVVLARQGSLRVVVKQALGRLRVADEWFARRDRAVTEGEALVLAQRLVPGFVPEVLDVDREACAITISAAPPGWRSWKEDLLSKKVEPKIATCLGELLASLHTATAGDVQVAQEFGNGEAFEELRVGPYYRTVAARRPEIRPAVDEFIRQMEATRVCLVHGDYSPKNVLVGDNGLWVIDFEVAHHGDPAFDVAFMLNHLLLKRLHVREAAEKIEMCAVSFWEAYAKACGARVPDVAYVMGHVGCLMVARVDGKSPVEYLTSAERDTARRIGLGLVSRPPDTIEEGLARLRAGTGQWSSGTVNTVGKEGKSE